MNKRIKFLRKKLEMTQTEFAQKIGLSQNYVWMIERGDRCPSDRTIADICREFDVSEDWLRTGEGEMFIQLTPDEERLKFLAELVKGETDPEVLAFVDALGKAPRDQLKTIMEFVLSVAEEYKKNNPDA